MSRASRPVRALFTLNPLSVRPVSSIMRIEGSSSATRIRGGCFSLLPVSAIRLDLLAARIAECESGSRARPTRNPNRSAVQLGDFTDHARPSPVPGYRRPRRAVRDRTFRKCVRDRSSGCRNHGPRPRRPRRTIFVCRDNNLRPGRTVFDGIRNEVRNGPRQQVQVGQDRIDIAEMTNELDAYVRMRWDRGAAAFARPTSLHVTALDGARWRRIPTAQCRGSR